MHIQYLEKKIPLDTARKTISFDKECDFDITFNANLNWHFGSDPMTSQQIDFRLVAAKQLTQGLGYHSNLEKVKVGRDILVVPRKYYDKDPSKTYYSRMSPMDDLTNSLIKSVGNVVKAGIRCLRCSSPSLAFLEPFQNTFDLFEKAGLYSLNETQQINQDFSSRQFRRIGKRLGRPSFILTNSGPLYFRDPTLSEINQQYWDTSEFLMSSLSSLVTGITLIDKMVQNQGKLFGNSTLAVLKFIGYSIKSNPTTIEFANINT